MMLALADMRPELRRCVVNGPAGSIKVYFDHFTGHSSGQRCWTFCPGNHEHCLQYRQSCDFADRDAVARYFYTWAVRHLDFETRSAHLSWRPSQADLDNAGLLDIQEF